MPNRYRQEPKKTKFKQKFNEIRGQKEAVHAPTTSDRKIISMLKVTIYVKQLTDLNHFF